MRTKAISWNEWFSNLEEKLFSDERDIVLQVKFLELLVGHIGVPKEVLTFTYNLMVAIHYSHRLNSQRNEEAVKN